MADKNGRVWGSIPGLANRARVPVEDTRIAIATFMEPDPDSRTPDFEGRRIELIDGGWRLLNHEKYRAIRDEEATLESKRKYINTRRAAERKAKGVEQSRSVSPDVDRGRDNAEAYTDTESESKTSSPVEKSARKRAAPAIDCPADVDAQVWADWCTHRKGKRATVTATVLDGARADAAKAGVTLTVWLAAWVKTGTQGFSADWPMARAALGLGGGLSKHGGFAAKDYSEGIGQDGSIL